MILLLNIKNIFIFIFSFVVDFNLIDVVLIIVIFEIKIFCKYYKLFVEYELIIEGLVRVSLGWVVGLGVLV